MLLVVFTAVVCWSSENGTLDRHMWDVNALDYHTVALVSLRSVDVTEIVLTNCRAPSSANSSSLVELV
jgi:hypothetical protein